MTLLNLQVPVIRCIQRPYWWLVTVWRQCNERWFIFRDVPTWFVEEQATQEPDKRQYRSRRFQQAQRDELEIIRQAKEELRLRQRREV